MAPNEKHRLGFVKLVATGNDFVFVDARAALPVEFARLDRAVLARNICNRHFGVGSDGLVFVKEVAGVFKWEFFNSDGSGAEMCGNATRCMGRWGEVILGLKQIKFMTSPGAVSAEIVPTSHVDVISRLPFVHAELKSVSYQAEGETRPATFINTGVPHIVVEVSSLEAAMEGEADVAALRFHSVAGERGANVTFIEIQRKDFFRTVTFERGVEDFTLSCGTGVLAAAAVGLNKYGGLKAEVSTPGGNLFVEYGPGFHGVSLRGPAIEVCQGTIDPMSFKELLQ
jgi:diaminopimelate epimerase